MADILRVDAKKSVCIEIDLDALASYTDEYLATCWYVAQANPASSFDSPEPEQISEHIGRRYGM